MGLYLCPLYDLGNPDLIGKKIYKHKVNLPAFTWYNPTNASEFNLARANLFSLLIPIHDRATANHEFLLAADKWRNEVPGVGNIHYDFHPTS